MATGSTTNLGLTTVQTGDVLPEAAVKANFETLDNYVAAKKLTNKSGLTVAANSVVIADTTTDSSYTTTTVANKTNVIGVTQTSAAANALAIVKQYGVVSVLVTGATSRGDWLTTSTTAGQAVATAAASTAPTGVFAIALSATVGAGTVTAIMIATGTGLGDPTTTAGDLLYRNSSAVTRLAAGTVGGQSLVLNATLNAPAWDDPVRAAFRSNRRMVGLWTAQAMLESGSEFGTGVGFGSSLGAADHGLSDVSGEPVYLVGAATATTNTLGSLDYNGGFIKPLSPNHSPRMLVRVRFPVASADITTCNVGFMTTTNLTAAGAFLRIVTTGNVFFVTDQAGTETVTDLGVLSRVNVLGFEIETPDAGVTWYCRNQAGTVLATHTTNVPAAATPLFYGITTTTAGTAHTTGWAYCYVEATFA